jgi:hypothetical protein
VTEFDDLRDEEKVKFVEAELAATLNKLDDMIARLTGLRTEVKDPDKLVRFTLGDDGRLRSLFIDDAVRTRLNNLGLGKCCPSLRMTTTARRFVIEDCDDHHGSRVVVCTTNVRRVPPTRSTYGMSRLCCNAPTL